MSRLLKPKFIALCISTALSSAVTAEDLNEAQPEPTSGFAQALEQAKQHDPELKYAFYNYKAEQEQDNIALSQLLPSVQLSSSYVKQDIDDYYTQNKASSIEENQRNRNPARYAGTQDYYTSQLSIKQSLVNVSAWQAYSSSKDAVRQSQYTYTRAEQELIYRLSQAYLKALLAAQQVFINEEKLESLQLKLDQTSRMSELGVGDRLNVLRATSSRDVARSDLLQAKSRLEDANTQLADLTGGKIDIPLDWVANGHKVLPVLVEGSEKDWISKVQDNASLLAESSNVRSKEKDASARSAQHLPTLDLSLSYVDQNSDDLYKYNENLTASINLTIPIYSGGRTSAQSRQAEASYNAAQARYEKTLSDKKQVVKLAFSQLSSYRERLQALEESRKSSKAFLDAAERQADLSLGSQVDVLEARTELYDVRLEFASTLSDYLIADLNLLLETGQLNEQTLQKYDRLFNQQAN